MLPDSAGFHLAHGLIPLWLCEKMLFGQTDNALFISSHVPLVTFAVIIS